MRRAAWYNCFTVRSFPLFLIDTTIFEVKALCFVAIAFVHLEVRGRTLVVRTLTGFGKVPSQLMFEKPVFSRPQIVQGEASSFHFCTL